MSYQLWTQIDRASATRLPLGDTNVVDLLYSALLIRCGDERVTSACQYFHIPMLNGYVRWRSHGQSPD
jgi:hypothetical protein